MTTTVLGLLVALLSLAGPATANPTGTGVVISEVYSAGGNPGSAYTADFVELFNPTASDVDLTGTSLQYRAGNGTHTVLALSGFVRAGAHFLVQMTAAGVVPDDGDAALPAADLVASPAVPLGGLSGQVFLATTLAAFAATGNVAGNAALLDMVGYGTAGTFEGANTGVLLTEDTSASRDDAGTDTDNNANDFSEGVPSPQATPAGTPIGTITDDITRAFSNGSFVNDEWVAPTPRTEDRGVGVDARPTWWPMRCATASPPPWARPTSVWCNPGDLHDDLLYVGDTTTNPANTDGGGHLRRGQRGAAVPRQHLAGRPHRRRAEDGAGAAVADQPGRARPIAAVPAAGSVGQRPDDPGPDQPPRAPGSPR